MKKFFDYINPFQDEDKPREVEQPVHGGLKPLSGTDYYKVALPNNGGTDPKVIQYFDELMKKANLPGPDYHEFKRALREMTNVPEEMAYKTTFVAFKTMEVTKEKLVSSADEYINIIKKDTEGFQGTVDKKIETEITARGREIAANVARIRELNQEMTDLQAKNIKLSHEAQTQQLSIDSTKDAYLRTSQTIIAEMESDKTKINQYL